jgi:Tfp pilus assembly protein PilF
MTPISGDNPLAAVSEALRQRDPRRAAELAEAALRAGARHPLLYTARAMWLSEQGRNDEALVAFRTAETMGPLNPALKNAIALCLMRLDRPAEAVKEYDAVLALMPEAAPIHCRKGWACEMAGDLENARAAHERAIALDPKFAEALARLAYLAARRAAWSEARDYAGRALALGRQPAATLALAMAALEDKAGDAEALLKTILSDDQAGPTDKRLANGLMGDLCDRLDRCEEAFAFYSEANRIAAGMARSAGALPMLETVQHLRRRFESMAPRPRAASTEPARHIFVLGFLRSGTTLVQEILAARDDTVVLDEKDALIDGVEAFMTGVDGLDRLWASDAATLDRYRAAYWQRVKGFGIDVTGKVLVDKMPLATVRLPLIQKLFPDAAIVFVRRDPRDVVWSCFRQRFVMNAATQELLTLEGAARLYAETMQLAALYREKLSPKLFELGLEDLISDFDGRVRALCDFAGLDWQDGMRDFAGRSADHAVTTPSSIQIVRGLNSQGVGRWRRYAGPMAAVESVLAPWVERYAASEQQEAAS